MAKGYNPYRDKKSGEFTTGSGAAGGAAKSKAKPTAKKKSALAPIQPPANNDNAKAWRAKQQNKVAYLRERAALKDKQGDKIVAADLRRDAAKIENSWRKK